MGCLAGDISLRPTDAAGAARRLAREAVAEGFETVIAAGGDGTVNEVLSGLHDSPSLPDSVRLAVIPLGTVNVFAKEFGIPSGLKAALAVARSPHTLALDLPLAEYDGPSGKEQRCFAQLAGAGLDARAIDRVQWKLKKKLGPLAYVIAGFQALRDRLPPVVAATPSGPSAAGELVLLGNGRYYGGRYLLFPDARADDGLLDVTVFPTARFVTLVRVGIGWATGNLHRFAGTARWQAAEVRLECTTRMPFELDGDNVGVLPARFFLRPRAFRVAVP